MHSIATAIGTQDVNVTIPEAVNASGTVTTSRTYATTQDVMTELVNARVWIGFHYRNSAVTGEALGTAAANWALARYFLATDTEDDD